MEEMNGKVFIFWSLLFDHHVIISTNYHPNLTFRPYHIIGPSTARALLSHLISELTFSIKSKYKELLLLAKSTHAQDNQIGLDRMENLLTVMLSASQFALLDIQCVSRDVGDLHKGRLHTYYYQVAWERGQSRGMSQGGDQEDDSQMQQQQRCYDVADRKVRHRLGQHTPYQSITVTHPIDLSPSHIPSLSSPPLPPLQLIFQM